MSTQPAESTSFEENVHRCRYHAGQLQWELLAARRVLPTNSEWRNEAVKDQLKKIKEHTAKFTDALALLMPLDQDTFDSLDISSEVRAWVGELDENGPLYDPEATTFDVSYLMQGGKESDDESEEEERRDARNPNSSRKGKERAHGGEEDDEHAGGTARYMGASNDHGDVDDAKRKLPHNTRSDSTVPKRPKLMHQQVDEIYNSASDEEMGGLSGDSTDEQEENTYPVAWRAKKGSDGKKVFIVPCTRCRDRKLECRVRSKGTTRQLACEPCDIKHAGLCEKSNKKKNRKTEVEEQGSKPKKPAGSGPSKPGEFESTRVGQQFPSSHSRNDSGPGNTPISNLQRSLSREVQTVDALAVRVGKVEASVDDQAARLERWGRHAEDSLKEVDRKYDAEVYTIDKRHGKLVVKYDGLKKRVQALEEGDEDDKEDEDPNTPPLERRVDEVDAKVDELSQRLEGRKANAKELLRRIEQVEGRLGGLEGGPEDGDVEEGEDEATILNRRLDELAAKFKADLEKAQQVKEADVALLTQKVGQLHVDVDDILHRLESLNCSSDARDGDVGNVKIDLLRMRHNLEHLSTQATQVDGSTSERLDSLEPDLKHLSARMEIDTLKERVNSWRNLVNDQFERLEHFVRAQAQTIAFLTSRLEALESSSPESLVSAGRFAPAEDNMAEPGMEAESLPIAGLGMVPPAETGTLQGLGTATDDVSGSVPLAVTGTVPDSLALMDWDPTGLNAFKEMDRQFAEHLSQASD